MATKSEMNKIVFVLVILFILLTGLVFVRQMRQAALRTQLAKQQPKMTDITLPTVESDNATGILRLVPARYQAKVGDAFTLSVELDAIGKQLDGADAILRFDPTVLEVVDINPGTYFSTYPRKTIDNVNGSVKVTGFTSSVLPPLESPQQLFTLNMQAKKAGSYKVTIEFIKDETTLSNLVEHITSKNILGEVENAQVVIQG